MGNFFPDELIDEIKARNDIVDIISNYIQVKSKGSSHKALCPFHNEKTPSFVINRDKQIFKCFGCGESGDVIGFVMRMENLDFVEAIKLLAQNSNISLEQYDTSDTMKREMVEKHALFELNKKAAVYFYNNLTKQANPALDYLKRRGLTAKTIKSFGLGYAPNNWHDLMHHFLNAGYSIDDLIKCGLVTKDNEKKKQYDRFRNRIMFPIFDVRGNVIGFGGRVLNDALPKYLNSPETSIFNKSNTLYGLNFARRHINDGRLILVEGYMDVIVLHQYGYHNCVAALGTSFTKGHLQLLQKYASEVIICFDGDAAGEKATQRATELLQDTRINVKVLVLEDNMDPDDFIKQKGKFAFEEQLKAAISLIEYKIQTAKNKWPLNTSEGKIQFIKAVVSIIKEIKSPVEREVYVQKIEKDFGVSKNVLLMEIYGKDGKQPVEKNQKYTSKNIRDNKYIEAVPLVEQKGHIIAERQLIKFLLTNPDMIAKIEEKIEPEDFLIGSYRALVEYIFSNYRIASIEPDHISVELPQLKESIKDILDTDIEFIDIAKTLEKYIINLKRYKLLYEQKELQQQQMSLIQNKKLNKEEVEKELLTIGLKIMKINTEIQKLQP